MQHRTVRAEIAAHLRKSSARPSVRPPCPSASDRPSVCPPVCPPLHLPVRLSAGFARVRPPSLPRSAASSSASGGLVHINDIHNYHR